MIIITVKYLNIIINCYITIKYLFCYVQKIAHTISDIATYIGSSLYD